jgi:hypothetical protein
MNKFFKEKQITLIDSGGEELMFFMRPIKVKELQVIHRISNLAKEKNSDQFTTPMLLALVIDSLSIDAECIPVSASEELIQIYIDYNFPEVKDEEKEKLKKIKDRKELKDLTFYMDFLINQGHSITDIMEMTLPQFSDFIEAAANRINPPKKVLDPLTAFRQMGIPIRGENG